MFSVMHGIRTYNYDDYYNGTRGHLGRSVVEGWGKERVLGVKRIQDSIMKSTKHCLKRGGGKKKG
jgi:hypothetical protein